MTTAAERMLAQGGGRAGAEEDLAQEQQPDRMRQRGQCRGALRPVGSHQVLGGPALLPLVVLSGRQVDGAGEEHRARRRHALLQPAERPQGAGVGGDADRLDRRPTRLEAGHALLEPRQSLGQGRLVRLLLTHRLIITQERNYVYSSSFAEAARHGATTGLDADIQ